MRNMTMVAKSRFVWWCESKWAKEHRLDGVGTAEWESYQKAYLELLAWINCEKDDVSDVVEYIVDLMATVDPEEFAECYTDRAEAVAEVARALDIAPWTLIDMLDEMSSVSPSAMGVMAEYDSMVDRAADVVEYIAELLVEVPKRLIRRLLDSKPWELIERLSRCGDKATPIVVSYNRLVA